MSTQSRSVLSPLLFFGFFRESGCICDGTIWTKVGWEIFPEEVHSLKAKAPPSRCLPYPLDKFCCNFANVDLIQSSLRLAYILVQALLLILFVLSVHYLWMKWTRHQRKVNLPCRWEESWHLKGCMATRLCNSLKLTFPAPHSPAPLPLSDGALHTLVRSTEVCLIGRSLKLSPPAPSFK